MPRCPICQEFIYVPVDGSPDAIMNSHIQSECRKHLITTHREVQKGNLSIATRCDQPTGCKNLEKYSTIICTKCRRQYCITHRLPMTHRCEEIIAKEKEAKIAMKQSSSSSSSSSSTIAPPPAASAPVDKHARGKELMAKLAAKREAKAAAAHPYAAPSSNGAGGGGFLTLQQIRSGANATIQAIASVMPGSSSAAQRTQPQAAPSSSPSPPAPSSSPSSSSSPSPAPPAASYRPILLTGAAKRSAIGDSAIAESDRFYLQVDVTAIKSKKAPTLCFFARKHTIGKILDLICDATSIENENHLPTGKRLFLCAPRIGATFPSDIALQLLEGALLQGDIVTLRRTPIE